MFKLLLQFIFAITMAASEFETFGPQDMLDLNQDDVGGKKRLEPLKYQSEEDKEIVDDDLKHVNDFIEGGNNISKIAKLMSERNETLNGNYLLAEEFWGKPVFEVVDGMRSCVPRLKTNNTFGGYPCGVWKYRCPKKMSVLWAFKHGQKYCYVPWPGYQLVQYAECSRCKTCLAPFQLGTCLQSDFVLRNFLVVCVKSNLQKFKLNWQYVTKFVPTGCGCRTC